MSENQVDFQVKGNPSVKSGDRQGVQGGDQVSDSCEEHLHTWKWPLEPAAHSKDGDTLSYNFSLENAEQNRRTSTTSAG